jgi:chitin disaccharide deacetylase
VVMCHPGFVDEQLLSLDPLTYQREHEHAYLAGEEFPALLAEKQVTLG